MTPSEIKTAVMDLLQQDTKKALTAPEIGDRLRLKGAQRKHLQKWIVQMVRSGEIVCIHQNRYALGKEVDLVTGILDLAKSGNGFVSAPGRPDSVFVSQADTGTALPGDRVTVRVDNGPLDEGHTRQSGKIIRILERTRRDVVGTLQSTGRFYHVVPIDTSYKQNFYVPDPKGAKIGDRVVIRFANWENRSVNPEAEVIDVIGPADNPSLDTLSIIRHFNLRVDFPPVVLREAEQVAPYLDRPGKRMDLRERYILTIDPLRARDFDDALSLERDGQGRRVLGVHIADVSHFVRPGSALDKEAVIRGNSVYFPDRVLPMLPEQLSNGVCSLRPDEDRFAFSVFMTVDDSGRVVDRTFTKSVIRSRLRLTYEEAVTAIDPASGPRAPVINDQAGRLLRELHALAQQFRKRRFAQWALDMDIPECDIEMGPDGRMTGIRVVKNDVSHQLVEECMVAANEAVALALSTNGVPVLFRVHDAPKEKKIEDLTGQLLGMGFRPGDLSERKNMAMFLKSIQDHPLAVDVRIAVLKSMNRAVYASRLDGHFGLAKKYYAHFTSPIRRYPDLLIHRQLAGWLAEKRETPYSKGQLDSFGESCTMTEWTAEEAEREVVEIKKLRFLAEQLARKRPEAYDAVVVTVTNFGMFVEIQSLQIQGLVHVSSVSDRYVQFDRAKLELRAGKQSFRVGKKVRVKVTGVDIEKRRVDFALVQAPSAEAAAVWRDGDSEKRRHRGASPQRRVPG